MVDLSELDGILALRPRGDGGGPEENPERWASAAVRDGKKRSLRRWRSEPGRSGAGSGKSTDFGWLLGEGGWRQASSPRGAGAGPARGWNPGQGSPAGSEGFEPTSTLPELDFACLAADVGRSPPPPPPSLNPSPTPPLRVVTQTTASGRRWWSQGSPWRVRPRRESRGMRAGVGGGGGGERW
jgi:hypothetical protein